ncbi:TPA: response regulator transcription factor [Klebsiella aerogenes]|nr:response regulator transcription factor [Klebsiella aerogenes]
MIKVVVSLADAYLRLAMVSLVCQEMPASQVSEFSWSLERTSVQKADIIIADLTPGGLLLCDPRLAERRPGCRVILVTGQLQVLFPLLPCMDTLGLIDTRAPLRFAAGVVRSGLLNRTSPLPPEVCQYCRSLRPAPAQQRVADCLFRGMNCRETARQLALRTKTVYAHKRAIMVRFGLQNDYDLCAFLRIQQKKEWYWQQASGRTE